MKIELEIFRSLGSYDAHTQVAERLPLNPELHVGTHVVPDKAPELQFPLPAFRINGKPAHVHAGRTGNPLPSHVTHSHKPVPNLEGAGDPMSLFVAACQLASVVYSNPPFHLQVNADVALLYVL